MYAPQRPLSRAPSPLPYIPSSPSMPLGPNDATSPFRRPTSSNDFRVENVGKSPSALNYRGHLPPETTAFHYDDPSIRQRVAALIAARDRQFATTGHIFVDTTQLTLFFRSKTGIAQSLDFPIDIEYNAPPSLDVLVAGCRPHQTSEYGAVYGAAPQSMLYPPNLPLTTTLDLANYPILDAVKNSLFPDLPPNHFLTAKRDKLEIVLNGGHLSRQPAHLRSDGRSATILLTLPVRFQGGAVVVRGPNGAHERFVTKSRSQDDLEWVAFLANSDYETEPVEKGYKIMLSYAVHVKNFSPEGAAKFESLTIPSDIFFDVLAPVMNMTRGRTVGFYLTHDYAVNPAVLTADALIPMLKGGDYLLYHAFKMYKLTVNLHWAAGEYFWPQDRTVEFYAEDIATSTSPLRSSSILGRPPPFIPPSHGLGHSPSGFNSTYPLPEQDPLRMQVEQSGGQLLGEANITVLGDWNANGAHGAVERVPFISHGELKKFVVNVLMLVFIP